MSHSLTNHTDAQRYGLATGHRPWSSFTRSATDCVSRQLRTSGRIE
jgi:hypothetical protein